MTTDEAPRYPVTPQHPPRLVRVRLQWQGRIMEAARVAHPKSKKIVWVMRRSDGSDRYLPPKNAQNGAHPWPPEPEWWQPLQPEKWDAPLPPALPPLPAWRRHDGVERMVNIRARKRRRRRPGGDQLPADDKPWWWDATAIRYEPRGSVSIEMAEGRLMRALTDAGVSKSASQRAVDDWMASMKDWTGLDIAAAKALAEAEARHPAQIRQRLALTPADRADWLEAMAWFSDLGSAAGGFLTDEQRILIWRSRLVSWRSIGGMLDEHPSTVRRDFARALEDIHRVANADPSLSTAAHHIRRVRERNRAYKRQGTVI